MDIGVVIKKYRKEAGMTQEEMANRLGVTTPAVNKWENSNSKPDIELLAPIARLFDISLDTLLSFHEYLSDTEIEEIIRKMDRMFSEEGYEKTYEWALRLIKEYPNCNMLIWQAAVMLDARRITDKCTNPEKYDKQINAWYELALHDENEEIQHHAADSLFGFYLRKKNYAKAEKYLDYFSEHDPMKSYYQGRLLQEQGKIKEAYEKYENVIFSGFSTLNFVLSTMAGLALRENDIGYARFLSGKVQAVAHTLEMGKYNEYSPMLDIVCAGISALVINTVNSLGLYTKDAFSTDSDEETGKISLSFSSPAGHDADLLMKSLVLGLQGIQNTYGNDYIILKFREV